jgi:hypothetical protein
MDGHGGAEAGKGRWRRAGGLLLDSQGRLVVRDQGNLRYSVFGRDGSFHTTYTAGFISPWYPWPGQFTRDEGFVDFGGTGAMVPGDRSVRRTTLFSIAMGKDFSRQDTLPPLVMDQEVARGTPLQRPYSGGPTFWLDRGGTLWWGHPREYRVIKRSLPGDTILTFSLPVTPEPVTEEERIRYARTYSQRYAISTGSCWTISMWSTWCDSGWRDGTSELGPASQTPGRGAYLASGAPLRSGALSVAR